MSNYIKFKDVIQKRAMTNDEWAAGVEQCWKEMTDVFADDIGLTIQFLDNECSADEYSWLSEVFERIADLTKSAEFIAALNRLAIKYPEETKKYNILSFINSAQLIVESSNLG